MVLGTFEFLTNGGKVLIMSFPFQYFRNLQGFQENDVITGGKMALFGETSTQINCIGPMNLCAKFHAFSTICKIFSQFTYTNKAEEILLEIRKLRDPEAESF